jgi:ribonuclease inhibitor
MRVDILGDQIFTEHDFHSQIATAMDVRRSYGRNLDALWDLLSASVERPIEIVWRDAAQSRERLGEHFDKIVAVLERVRLQDEQFGWTEKFTYSLE